MNKQELETAIKEVMGRAMDFRDKVHDIIADPDASLFEDAYCDMLNETVEEFMGMYAPSRTLEAVDPIAYRVGLLDYLDGIEPPMIVDVYEDQIGESLTDTWSEFVEERDDLFAEFEEMEDLDDASRDRLDSMLSRLSEVVQDISEELML